MCIRDRYSVDTDASNTGLGAVLSQVQNGEERVTAYYSKTLSKPEGNYCVTRRELLAIVRALEHFHKSVSYTHLDVYKRQVLCCRSNIFKNLFLK